MSGVFFNMFTRQTDAFGQRVFRLLTTLNAAARRRMRESRLNKLKVLRRYRKNLFIDVLDRAY